MAQHRLGDRQKAQQTLALGLDLLHKQEQLRKTPASRLHFWQDRLEEQLLRREAEELILGKK
jgi:hypothetical protein